jgi:hypothetical protein
VDPRTGPDQRVVETGTGFATGSWANETQYGVDEDVHSDRKDGVLISL